MSFYLDHRTLGNGKIYSEKLHLKVSVNAKNTTDAPAARDLEKVDVCIKGVSPDLIEERIKANLEPLNEQISTLIELLNQLIQKKTRHIIPHQTQSRHSPSGEERTVRTLPGSASGSMGVLPDTCPFATETFFP